MVTDIAPAGLGLHPLDSAFTRSTRPSPARLGLHPLEFAAIGYVGRGVIPECFLPDSLIPILHPEKLLVVEGSR